jgi:hypothetical protein
MRKFLKIIRNNYDFDITEINNNIIDTASIEYNNSTSGEDNNIIVDNTIEIVIIENSFVYNSTFVEEYNIWLIKTDKKKSSTKSQKS